MNIPDNFGAIDKPYSEYNNAKVAVLPVPFEGTVTYGKGTARGPKAIIEASKNMELFDEELNKNTFEIGIHTLPALKVSDDPKKTIESLYNKAKQLLDEKKFIVMLGGEHSVTQGIIKALKKKYHDLSVLQIDAHSDLREEYDLTKYSHACVMKRVLDLDVKVVQVGIRSTSEEEQATFRKNRKNIFLARDVATAKTDAWMDDVISRLSKNVFITIDVDGFDPSIMQSTGTPEPGGLQWYPVLKLLRKVAAKRNVVGFDVVELAPIKGMSAPDFLCAKLVYKLIGYVFEK
ncbi:MAG: agmatinase [Candidatus Aenigmarchaeota archaeon]|nr:agmatinase [Candidatus Aenigmarchaeota archaeon]